MCSEDSRLDSTSQDSTEGVKGQPPTVPTARPRATQTQLEFQISSALRPMMGVKGVCPVVTGQGREGLESWQRPYRPQSSCHIHRCAN